MRKRLAMLVLAVPAGLMAQRFMGAPAGTPSTLQPQQLKGVGFDQKLDTQLPVDLTFQDDTGREVRLGDYFRAKPVILAPVYYECPMLCSQILSGLISSMRAVSFTAGADFDVVAVSFDPTEKPEQAAKKKKMYSERYARPGAEGGFHFLTGTEANVKALMSAMGFRYAYDPATKQYAHAAGLLLTTPDGRISRVLYGVEYAPRDLRLGLIEAAENKIGTPVDQLLLFCFHYDPATGKYTTVVMNILRLTAGTTLAVLLGLIVVLVRRDRATLRPRTT